MQSLTNSTSANANLETPPLQILQSTQTQEIHATELQHTLTSFNIKRVRLVGLARSFATRWGEGRIQMGPGMDPSHQTLLEDCYDTLGPAALVAAVTPRGFRGALGGYGSLQRIATTFSSGSNGHSGHLADRSASLSLTPSSPLLELPPNGLHDDENHQLVAADNHSERAVERGTIDGGVNHQGNAHGLFGGPSGLLARPPLWKSRDHKKSTLSDRPGSALLASSPPQAKQETFDSYTPLTASAGARSIGPLAIPHSPPILAVERGYNNKLKRARNSAEDREEKDAERQGVVDNRTRASVSAPPRQRFPNHLPRSPSLWSVGIRNALVIQWRTTTMKTAGRACGSSSATYWMWSACPHARLAPSPKAEGRESRRRPRRGCRNRRRRSQRESRSRFLAVQGRDLWRL
ncbi:hypothetical protein BJ912DRAFT_954564, partial [Pholiota molesta]